MDIFNIPKIEEPNQNESIWKYMDLAKFVLLLKNGLWFSRVDLLEDKFEGTLSPPTGYLIDVSPGQSKEYDTNIVNSMRESYEENRKWYIVNCWNLNENESVALWHLYVKGTCGVAIQSTYGKLRKVICENSDKPRVIGKVKYIDRKKDKTDTSPMLMPAFNKDLIFRHEEEIRALIINQKRTQSMYDNPCFSGLYVRVDLNKLIERVVVAPKLAKWKYEVIEHLLSGNKIKKPVHQSSFDQEPY